MSELVLSAGQNIGPANIVSGLTVTLDSGATATGDTVYAGANQVENGGVASGTVLSGGAEYVVNGGSSATPLSISAERSLSPRPPRRPAYPRLPGRPRSTVAASSL